MRRPPDVPWSPLRVRNVPPPFLNSRAYPFVNAPGLEILFGSCQCKAPQKPAPKPGSRARSSVGIERRHAQPILTRRYFGGCRLPFKLRSRAECLDPATVMDEPFEARALDQYVVLDDALADQRQHVARGSL